VALTVPPPDDELVALAAVVALLVPDDAPDAELELLELLELLPHAAIARETTAPRTSIATRRRADFLMNSSSLVVDLPATVVLDLQIGEVGVRQLRVPKQIGHRLVLDQPQLLNRCNTTPPVRTR